MEEEIRERTGNKVEGRDRSVDDDDDDDDRRMKIPRARQRGILFIGRRSFDSSLSTI